MFLYLSCVTYDTQSTSVHMKEQNKTASHKRHTYVVKSKLDTVCVLCKAVVDASENNMKYDH